MPEPRVGIDAADAVVADLERQDTVVVRGDQLDDVRVGVLGDVRERLGGDVVGGRLDRRRQPLVEPHVDVDRDVRPTRERPAAPARVRPR